MLSSPQMSDDPAKIFHTGMHHSAFEYDSMDEHYPAEGDEPHQKVRLALTAVGLSLA